MEPSSVVQATVYRLIFCRRGDYWNQPASQAASPSGDTKQQNLIRSQFDIAYTFDKTWELSYPTSPSGCRLSALQDAAKGDCFT